VNGLAGEKLELEIRIRPGFGPSRVIDERGGTMPEETFHHAILETVERDD
jgi:hypothetical protein